MHESGTFIKMDLTKPSLELQRAVIGEAHENGLKVVAHATCLADTIEILGAGADGLTHTILDQPPTDEFVAAYKKNDAHCNPTLATLGSATTEGHDKQQVYAHDPRVKDLISQEACDRMCMCMAFATELSIENAYESVRKLKKAGITILW